MSGMAGPSVERRVFGNAIVPEGPALVYLDLATLYLSHQRNRGKYRHWYAHKYWRR